MENQNGTRRSKRFAENEICIEFDAISENEGLARVVIAAFVSNADPTVEQVEDVKTAVSEAVTNAIIHGYKEQGGRVVMQARLSEEGELTVDIMDEGVGIADVEQAMQPLFTTGPENERSGMGFHLWRHLWTGCMYKAAWEKEPMYICGSVLNAARRSLPLFCRQQCGTEAGCKLWKRKNCL